MLLSVLCDSENEAREKQGRRSGCARQVYERMSECVKEADRRQEGEAERVTTHIFEVFGELVEKVVNDVSCENADTLIVSKLLGLGGDLDIETHDDRIPEWANTETKESDVCERGRDTRQRKRKNRDARARTRKHRHMRNVN